MKTLQINQIKMLVLFIINILAKPSMAQEHVTMSMRNVHVEKNKIHFTLYATNDGTKDLKLSAFSLGFNITAQEPDLKFQYQYIENSREKSLASFPAYTMRLDEKEQSYHARLTSTALRGSSAIELPQKQQMLLGKFEIVANRELSQYDGLKLSFQERIQIGSTTTQLLAYMPNSTQMHPFTPTNEKVTCVMEPMQWRNEQTDKAKLSENPSHTLTDDIALSMGIYPNPFDDVIHVKIESEKDHALKLTLLDITGKVVKEKPLSIQAGTSTLEISTSDLPQQVYLIKLTDGKQMTLVEKLTKR